MAAFFDERDRLKSLRGNEIESEPLRQNEGRQAGGQDQSKRIERPSGGVIVVRVIDFAAVTIGAGGRKAIEMHIEMRMDEPGMIVFGSRSRPGVNVLEWRQKKRQY